MLRDFRRLGRWMLPLRVALLSVIATQALNATFIRFAVTSLTPGQSAIGDEQIAPVTGTGAGGNGLSIGATGFDYTYLVWNTGALPIDGFLFDVGVTNTAAPSPRL
jgi:hypothetical protein